MNQVKKWISSQSELLIVNWATPESREAGQETLCVAVEPLQSSMFRSFATGRGLVSNGKIGVDMIHIPAGTGFEPHTHPGDHLLFIIAGEGTITYEGKIYPTHSGQVYLISGQKPHAVGAISDHVILAVGSPHKPVDSTDRMTPIEYQAIMTSLGELTCLICNLTGHYEGHLSKLGCPHDPYTTPIPDSEYHVPN